MGIFDREESEKFRIFQEYSRSPKISLKNLEKWQVQVFSWNVNQR